MCQEETIYRKGSICRKSRDALRLSVKGSDVMRDAWDTIERLTRHLEAMTPEQLAAFRKGRP